MENKCFILRLLISSECEIQVKSYLSKLGVLKGGEYLLTSMAPEKMIRVQIRFEDKTFMSRYNSAMHKDLDSGVAAELKDLKLALEMIEGGHA